MYPKTEAARALRERKCEPCEGGVDPLSEAQCADLMASLHADWHLAENATVLSRKVQFAGFHRTMSFVNAVAWIANTEGHHPLIECGYGFCKIVWTTNAISGLSANDFICAAKTDHLLEAV